jgi:adenosine 3'-phospho 5'-phosphosulfate transporter B2
MTTPSAQASLPLAHGTGQAPQTTTLLAQAGWCAFYASGIIMALLVYGLLQERVITMSYGGVLFTFSVFLVFVNRMFAVVFAVCMALAKGESLASKAPLWKYLTVSLSNVYASTCQYEALKYVSFPVQMLGKSFKMMPVMLWGIVISGKRYGVQDWAVAMCVTLGVTSFLLSGPVSSKTSTGNSATGFLLLLAFLGLDGFTSTMQEKLFREHTTSKYNQMLYVNMFSSIVSLATLVVAGDLLPALAFCTEHPAFVADALVLSGSAVSAQFFIYSQVKEFGALVYAATMNVRQVVSIMVSYATYHNTITLYQVASLLIVFGALFYKSFAGFVGEKSDEKRQLLPKGAASSEKA